MLLWSMPGIDGIGFFCAGFVVGLGAAFVTSFCTGFDGVLLDGDFVARRAAGLEAAGDVARLAVGVGAGMFTPGMLIPACDAAALLAAAGCCVVGTRASMPFNTGSVIARSRITGSAIMRE